MSKYRKKDARYAYEQTDFEHCGTSWIVFELTRSFNMHYALRPQYKAELLVELNARIKAGGLSRDEKRLIKAYSQFAKTIEILQHNRDVRSSRSGYGGRLK